MKEIEKEILKEHCLIETDELNKLVMEELKKRYGIEIKDIDNAQDN